MRFISKYPGYRFTGRKEKIERRSFEGNLIEGGTPPFICEFDPGATSPYEREIARKTFKFNGVMTDTAGNNIDPIFRVSVFDTDQQGILHEDAELRAEVERRLLENQGPENHILVEAVRLPEPWTGYDRLVAQGRRTNEIIAEKISTRVEDDSYTPEEIASVIEYEKANANRTEVVAALEALKTPEDLVVA